MTWQETSGCDPAYEEWVDGQNLDNEKPTTPDVCLLFPGSYVSDISADGTATVVGPSGLVVALIPVYV